MPSITPRCGCHVSFLQLNHPFPSSFHSDAVGAIRRVLSADLLTFLQGVSVISTTSYSVQLSKAALVEGCAEESGGSIQHLVLCPLGPAAELSRGRLISDMPQNTFQTALPGSSCLLPGLQQCCLQKGLDLVSCQCLSPPVLSGM